LFKLFRIAYESFFHIDENSDTHRFLRKCERKLLLPNLYVRLIEQRARKALSLYQLNKKLQRTRQGAIDYLYTEKQFKQISDM